MKSIQVLLTILLFSSTSGFALLSPLLEPNDPPPPANKNTEDFSLYICQNMLKDISYKKLLLSNLPIDAPSRDGLFQYNVSKGDLIGPHGKDQTNLARFLRIKSRKAQALSYLNQAVDASPSSKELQTAQKRILHAEKWARFADKVQFLQGRLDQFLPKGMLDIDKACKQGISAKNFAQQVFRACASSAVTSSGKPPLCKSLSGPGLIKLTNFYNSALQVYQSKHPQITRLTLNTDLATLGYKESAQYKSFSKDSHSADRCIQKELKRSSGKRSSQCLKTKLDFAIPASFPEGELKDRMQKFVDLALGPFKGKAAPPAGAAPLDESAEFGNILTVLDDQLRENKMQSAYIVAKYCPQSRADLFSGSCPGRSGDNQLDKYEDEKLSRTELVVQDTQKKLQDIKTGQKRIVLAKELTLAMLYKDIDLNQCLKPHLSKNLSLRANRHDENNRKGLRDCLKKIKGLDKKYPKLVPFNTDDFIRAVQTLEQYYKKKDDIIAKNASDPSLQQKIKDDLAHMNYAYEQLKKSRTYLNLEKQIKFLESYYRNRCSSGEDELPFDPGDGVMACPFPKKRGQANLVKRGLHALHQIVYDLKSLCGKPERAPFTCHTHFEIEKHKKSVIRSARPQGALVNVVLGAIMGMGGVSREFNRILIQSSSFPF